MKVLGVNFFLKHSVYAKENIMLSSFDTVPKRGRRIVRQTNGRTDGQTGDRIANQYIARHHYCAELR